MAEPLLLLLMVGVFAALALGFKLPLGPSLALAALAGALLGGHGLALRHLVEGAFGFFDIILIIAAAMIFMKSIQASGLLDGLIAAVLRAFHRRPAALLWTMMALAMLPGMITGSSLAAVLSTGPLIAPVLIKLGLRPARAAAFVASGAVLGMIAPPVNILVMILGAGVDMPYVGLTAPLLLIVLPLALIIPLVLGLGRIRSVADGEVAGLLPAFDARPYGVRIYLPLGLVLVLLVLQNIPGTGFAAMGLPAVFLLGSLTAAFCGRKFSFLRTSREAISDAMPILAILAGVGMFIQIMTLTGGRGWAVLAFLSLPPALLYAGIAVGMPLFGGVSAFGSASVLGVPFLLALSGSNALITAAALSAIVAIGDFMPPAAMAARFSAQIAGEKSLSRVLRALAGPALLILAAGLAVLWLAPVLDKVL
ncbi:MAG: Na+/H+ antiporter NhaC family protein [Acidobacteriota bacterium]|nr:Na+/H+ antiporter NhaC family protein [Acidobacteriota bacterium]